MQHEDYLDDFNEKELNQEVVTCVEGSIEGREKSLPPTKESYEGVLRKRDEEKRIHNRLFFRRSRGGIKVVKLIRVTRFKQSILC